MKIACVVLNYNDAETVEKLLGRIRGYRCFGKIVVVDNASADDSLSRLRQWEDEKIVVIEAEKNGGYGAGNNLGIRYAAECWGATHVVIANPDVSFEEDCVRGLAKVFRRHPETGAAAVRMEGEKEGPSLNAWRLHGFWGELLFMDPLGRRLLGRRLAYPPSYFRGKKAVFVDVVHGSMLMVSAEAFWKCGGYDEGIFLYQEEAALGRRLRESGFRTVFLLTESYRHEHAASISKTWKDEIARQRLREDSVLYYMKHYLAVRPWQERLARFWFWGIREEVILYRAAGRIFARRQGKPSP